MTEPCEKPPRIVRSGRDPVLGEHVVEPGRELRIGGLERLGVGIADPPDDVPVRAARRQRQRAARGRPEQAPLGVEHVKEREQVPLVGAAPVKEDERSLGVRRGRAVQ